MGIYAEKIFNEEQYKQKNLLFQNELWERIHENSEHN